VAGQWNSWFREELEASIGGVMGRDWRGRGVHWQIVSKTFADTKLTACCRNSVADPLRAELKPNCIEDTMLTIWIETIELAIVRCCLALRA